MKLFLSPHNDDAVLFGSFTLLREEPTVAVVFESRKQGPNAETRRQEDRAALEVLGVTPLFLNLPDDQPVEWDRLILALQAFSAAIEVYAPLPEELGHPQHNAVGRAAREVFGDRVRYYMTYTREGKSKGVLVDYLPEWAFKKLKALACYESQILRDDNVEHFMRDQHEYYAP
jgi:LmbE family N-acetylglucosaminyl deacetylase